MLGIKKRDTKQVFKAIAHQQGVSVSEVKERIMYYFLDMSDTEIAKLQNISRSGVFQNRHYALKQMKKSLEEEN